eukprot:scaffold50589_cov45-Phaeocystis_antarctica.AAC.2
MGVPTENITNVYNGTHIVKTAHRTDTKKFNRTPDMAVEAHKRYPCAVALAVALTLGLTLPLGLTLALTLALTPTLTWRSRHSSATRAPYP